MNIFSAEPISEGLVIIPTYNEIENIELIIKAVLEQSYLFDILIVDDNSPDGTGQKVRELQVLYPKSRSGNCLYTRISLGT